MSDDLYVVRLWDGFDGVWMDVTEPMPYEDANREWGRFTEGGTKHTRYQDIDYYKVFPADTTMHFSYATGQSQTRGTI